MRAALALWRGTPLSGLPAALGGYAFVQRLQEARLLLLEWRHDAELAAGCARLDVLVPELAALAAEHPLREAYHRQLMLALHRTGRQAEALAVHRDLRARLVEELGVEPGAAVREAHTEVLKAPATRRGAGEGQTPGTAAHRDGPRTKAVRAVRVRHPASGRRPGAAPHTTPHRPNSPRPHLTSPAAHPNRQTCTGPCSTGAATPSPSSAAWPA